MSARQALLSLVNGEPLVAEPQQARASRQFVEDFELVAMHYCLHELGEYDEAKVAALEERLHQRIPVKNFLMISAKSGENNGRIW